MRWSLNLSSVTLSSTARSTVWPLFASLSVATAELPSVDTSIFATTPRSFSSARTTVPVARVKATARDSAAASFFMFVLLEWVGRRTAAGSRDRGAGRRGRRRGLRRRRNPGEPPLELLGPDERDDREHGDEDGDRARREVRSEERRVGKECRSRWSP